MRNLRGNFKLFNSVRVEAESCSYFGRQQRQEASDASDNANNIEASGGDRVHRIILS